MIHYHGLPMTGFDSPIFSMQGKHCMISFAHPDQVAIAAEICQSFTLDNGAFSAWKAGKKFDIEKLAEWVSAWCMHPGCDWYCLPDVIGGDENDNAKIRAEWFNLVDTSVWNRGVPIWHMHEDIGVLFDFISWNAPCIAVGSSGEYATIGNTKWWGRIAEAMEILCDEHGVPKTKLHGLRQLDPTIFSHIPYSSADSTNVARNIGLDVRWNNYAPKSRRIRAQIMAERIESHASASRWNFESVGVQKNMELFG